MAIDPEIKVEGLAEVRRALKQLEDREIPKQLQRGLKEAAGLVAADAKTRVPSRSGRAAGSIRAGTSGASAYVAGGRKSVPYYGWLDFGTRSPRSGNPRSRGPWSGSGTGPTRGRFIYPALDANTSEVERAVSDAMAQAIASADLS